MAGTVEKSDELPFMAYLVLKENGQIERMTIASVDLRPRIKVLEEGGGRQAFNGLRR